MYYVLSMIKPEMKWPWNDGAHVSYAALQEWRLVHKACETAIEFENTGRIGSAHPFLLNSASSADHQGPRDRHQGPGIVTRPCLIEKAPPTHSLTHTDMKRAQMESCVSMFSRRIAWPSERA